MKISCKEVNDAIASIQPCTGENRCSICELALKMGEDDKLTDLFLTVVSDPMLIPILCAKMIQAGAVIAESKYLETLVGEER